MVQPLSDQTMVKGATQSTFRRDKEQCNRQLVFLCAQQRLAVLGAETGQCLPEEYLQMIAIQSERGEPLFGTAPSDLRNRTDGLEQRDQSLNRSAVGSKCF
jgi:hypothetical protein